VKVRYFVRGSDRPRPRVSWADILWSNDFRHLVKNVNYTNEVKKETKKEYTDEFKREAVALITE